MTPQADFFTSLRRSRRYPSRKCPKRSETSNTLNNWVDIDPATGHGSLLNVNRDDTIEYLDDQPYTASQEAGPSSAASFDTQRHGELGGGITRMLKRLSTDDGIEGDHESRKERLKRRSIQLLKLVGGESRKSSHSVVRSNTTATTAQIMHPHYDDRPRPSTSTSSRPSYSADGHSQCQSNAYTTQTTYTVTPPLTPPTPHCDTTSTHMHQNQNQQPPLYTTSPQTYSSRLPGSSGKAHPQSIRSSRTAGSGSTSKRSSRIPVNYFLNDEENTPPSIRRFASFVGDSDSSGKKPTLRPMYSTVPHNTPLSAVYSDNQTFLHTIMSEVDSSGSTPTSIRYAPKRRLIFENLINDPLPLPNGEPSRYSLPITSLEGLSLATTETHVEHEMGYPRIIGKSSTLEARGAQRGSGSTLSVKSLSGDNPEVNQFADPVGGYDPKNEPSSALEALWEYGSSASSIHEEDLGDRARLDGDEEDDGNGQEKQRQGEDSARRSQWAYEQDLEIDVDMQFSAREYPLPPSFTAASKKNSTRTSLSSRSIGRSAQPHEFDDDNSHDHDPTTGTTSDLRTSDGRSATILETQACLPSIQVLSPNPVVMESRRHKKNESITSMSGTTNPLSSPLSDGGLSLLAEGEGADYDDVDDVDEAVVGRGVNVAYRIPLKFERPEARRRTSLSVDSPFVNLYRATDPGAVELEAEG